MVAAQRMWWSEVPTILARCVAVLVGGCPGFLRRNVGLTFEQAALNICSSR